MRSGKKEPARLTWAACWTYLLIAVLSWVVLWELGDRWWPATVLLFGPRWILLLPAALLMLAAAVWAPRMSLPLLAAALTVVGPVMGLRLGLASWFASSEHATSLRIVTVNAQGQQGADGLARLVDLAPDLIAVQECSDPRSLEEALPGWQHHREGPLCLSTRFPIESADTLTRKGIEQAGGSGRVVRYTILTPVGRLSLANVHLDTPRRGLEGIRQGRVTPGLQALRLKSLTREIESRRARSWLNEIEGPLIVAGDFNLPVESVIYQRYWGDLANAFSTAGFGFGFTRFNGWIRVRIDHILLSGGWRTSRAFVGPNVGSDHRPLVAEVRWDPPR
jgi:endonuclease/exonuclease/phosphatase (EEP) superfamily protein YafD